LARLREEQYNRELDAYIDFLIATYCPDGDGECDENDVQNNEEDAPNLVHEDDGSSGTTTSSTRVKQHVPSVKIEKEPEKKTTDPDGDEARKISTTNFDSSAKSMDETSTAIASSTSKQATIDKRQDDLLPANGHNHIKNELGGGDDDDESEEEERIIADADTLDQYIEFLQEDYEQDQALDQYIDFIQQAYDTEKALDQYINFLLATTTASMPASLTRKNKPVNATAAAAASNFFTATTTATINRTIPAVTRNALIHAEDIIVVLPDSKRATDESLSFTSPPSRTEVLVAGDQRELDEYIDRIVTAVELDEYIDRLVESVSSMASDDRKVQEEPSTAENEMDQEEDPNRMVITATKRVTESIQQEQPVEAGTQDKDEGIDDYIASLVQGDSDSARAAIAIQHDAEEDGVRVPASANLASSTSSSARRPTAKRAVSVDDDAKTFSDADEEPKMLDETVDHGPKIAVGVTESSDPDGDDDDDDDDRDKQFSNQGAIDSDSVKTTLIDDEDNDIQSVAAGVSASPEISPQDREKDVEVQEEIPPKKKRKKKKVAASGSASAKQKVEESASFADAVADSTAATVDDSEEPIQSPNGIFRFLLRQGPIGHVLALVLVLLVEWVETYLPQLAELLALLWLKLAPAGLQRRMAPQMLGPGTGRTSSPSLQQMYSGRMPVKGRQRSKLSKRADEEALAQLQRIGDIQDAKYKHVSPSFMKRHGLGPYRNNLDNNPSRSEEDITPVGRPETRKKQRKAKSRYQEEEDESDIDWVVKGLETPTDTPLSLGVGVGKDGAYVSVGYEMEFGKAKKSSKSPGAKSRSSSRKKSSFDPEAITRDAVRKKTTGPRLSDRDGGSGVMGRLRAAATSNSLVSRSLFGAYPGDAVPPSEAADARGVPQLCAKYGYGDWSDDEEDDDVDEDDNHKGNRSDGRHKRSPRKHRGKKRRTKSTQEKVEDTEDSDLGFDDTLGQKSDRSATPVPHKKKRRRRQSSADGDSIETKMLRPPLELLNERKKRISSKDSGAIESAAREEPTMASIEELKKRHGSGQDKANVIRPALERLNEARKKSSKESND